MHVSLTPRLEQLVKEKVDSGLYNNASEVIREALRLLDQHDQLREIKLERLREAVRLGDEQLERGELSQRSIDRIIADNETSVRRRKKRA
jgi:antitoxin ParD1/3/4